MARKISCILNLSVIFYLTCLPMTFSATNNPIPLLTILVKKYYEQEMQLLQAIDEKNSKYIEKTLADDFEVRKSNHPGNPISRDLWVSNQSKAPTNQASLQQIAVRELGDLRIVSFILTSVQRQVPESFIVDIWQEKNNTPLLMARYTSQI